MIGELVGALLLLTRLPVGRWQAGAGPAPADCVWAYPLAGALVGAAGGLAMAAALALVTPLPAALLALTTMALLTGALHEDGLADVADGFGGGSTPARKLEVMRDSRIGAYGALALILAVSLRASVLASLSRPGAALIASGALSRSALLLPAVLLPSARPDGLGASLGRVPPPRATIAAILALCCTAALPAAAALASAAAAAIAGFGVAVLARQQIGGSTGDVLGAAQVAAETAALLAISAVLG